MSGVHIMDIDVLHWNASSVYVRCPFCERVHQHGFVDYNPGLRFSHCETRDSSYRFHFPIDQRTSQIAYEIDKRNVRFVNACRMQDLKDSSDDDELLGQQLMRAKISDEEEDDMVTAAQEYLTIPGPHDKSFQEKRIRFAISDCVDGRVDAVKQFLDESADAALFLRGKYPGGQTMLILASMEQSPDMVRLLLDRRCDVNAVTHKGRTALMEAALWGRLDNVKLLLANGADKYLRDFDNRRAIDMAQPIRRNREERDTRAPWYKEAAALRDRERREIVCILDDSPTRRQTVFGPSPSASAMSDHSFRRSTVNWSVSLIGPIQSYPITTDRKTVAVLERGGGYPQITAMSGWSFHRSPVYINGQEWTEKVMHLASVIGHTLAPRPDCDHGIPGQFHASHAEKQLMAYFVDRHVFLPEGTGPDKRIGDQIDRLKLLIDAKIDSCAAVRHFVETEQRIESLEGELFVADDPMPGEDLDIELVQTLKQDISNAKEQLRHLEAHPKVGVVQVLRRKLRCAEERERIHDRLLRLSEKAPPIALKRAVILISAPLKEICEDCLMFRDRLNEGFGLSIELAERTI